MGTIPSADVTTTASNVPKASGAFLVCGRASAPSIINSPGFNFSKSICSDSPCTSNTSPICKRVCPIPLRPISIALPARCNATTEIACLLMKFACCNVLPSIPEPAIITISASVCFSAFNGCSSLTLCKPENNVAPNTLSYSFSLSG